MPTNRRGLTRAIERAISYHRHFDIEGRLDPNPSIDTGTNLTLSVASNGQA